MVYRVVLSKPNARLGLYSPAAVFNTFSPLNLILSKITEMMTFNSHWNLSECMFHEYLRKYKHNYGPDIFLNVDEEVNTAVNSNHQV